MSDWRVKREGEEARRLTDKEAKVYERIMDAAEEDWHKDPDSDDYPPDKSIFQVLEENILLVGIVIGAGVFFFIYALISILIAIYLG